jgi:hypothetical protein
VADITPPVPKFARDYDDRTTNAVRSVLIEIGQILGSYRGKYAVVGGAVPWLLLKGEGMTHVGTLDVDLTLDAEALGGGEYAHLVEQLIDHGYEQTEDAKDFQLIRHVPAGEGEAPIDIVVDFLVPRDADLEKHRPSLIEHFRVVKADGADLSLIYKEMVSLSGAMPDGGMNRVEIAVCSIPALLVMKGFAMHKRLKLKDAYDVYYCIHEYEDGIPALADACRPLLRHANATEGYQYINEKFETVDSLGPTNVRRFLEKSNELQELTPEQLQLDAYGQVDAWLRSLGLRQ